MGVSCQLGVQRGDATPAPETPVLERFHSVLVDLTANPGMHSMAPFPLKSVEVMSEMETPGQQRWWSFLGSIRGGPQMVFVGNLEKSSGSGKPY